MFKQIQRYSVASNLFDQAYLQEKRSVLQLQYTQNGKEIGDLGRKGNMRQSMQGMLTQWSETCSQGSTRRKQEQS